DLGQTIRANLAGWREQLFALIDCRTPPEKVFGFSPDGRSAWTVDGEEKVVHCWEITRGQYIGSPLKHTVPVTALAVSPDGKLVATGCRDGTVHLWDAATGHIQRDLPGENTVDALAFSPNGQTLLIGRFEGKVGQGNTVFQVW